jgi:hypothetical protein
VCALCQVPTFGEVVKERVPAAGLDPTGFSAHSLRAGFATSAVQACVSTLKVRAQTCHASDAMLARYVRDRELFVGNAAGTFLSEADDGPGSSTSSVLLCSTENTLHHLSPPRRHHGDRPDKKVCSVTRWRTDR